MSEAKRIIDERLAKGEISEEEYDKLIKKISPTSDTSLEKVKLEDSATVTPPLSETPKSSPSSSKNNIWVNVGIGAFVVIGLTLWNKSGEREDGYSVCMRNGLFTQNSEGGCNCVADQMISRIPSSYFLPIVGGLFFKPPESEGTVIATNSIKYCQQRFR